MAQMVEQLLSEASAERLMRPTSSAQAPVQVLTTSRSSSPRCPLMASRSPSRRVWFHSPLPLLHLGICHGTECLARLFGSLAQLHVTPVVAKDISSESARLQFDSGQRLIVFGKQEQTTSIQAQVESSEGYGSPRSFSLLRSR